MMKVDLQILSILHEADLAIPPYTLAFELDYGSAYMSQRCRALTEVGLLELARGEKRGLYQITDLGRRYLNEELTEAEWEQIEAHEP